MNTAVNPGSDMLSLIVQKSDCLYNLLADFPDTIITPMLTGSYAVAFINKNAFDYVLNESLVSNACSEASVLGLLEYNNKDSMNAQVERAGASLTGRGVLVGFVDTGIDYLNGVFRNKDGSTRIAAIYDQTIEGSAPYGLIVGSEFTRDRINEALNVGNPYSIVPSFDSAGHGTFLASVCAGRIEDSFAGSAPDSELVVVKVRGAGDFYRERYLVPPWQENAYESSMVLLGIEYIIRKARELNKPAAICIGMGTNTGGHSGFSLFEEYIEAVSELQGVCVCIAAGNESSAKHHFKGKIRRTGGVGSVELQVGINTGDIYLNMWNNAPDRMAVAIRSPSGASIAKVPINEASVLESRFVLDKTVITVEYNFKIGGNYSQNTKIKLLGASPGIWSVIVHGDLILNGDFHIWLPIRGFVSPGVEFLSPDPNYTVVVPASAVGPVICGGYNYYDKSLYYTSSWGPTRLPSLAPDIVSPCVGIGGFYPWGPGIMEGTSVAAAITTGVCAAMLEWGVTDKNNILMSTFQIKTFLIRGAAKYPGITYPNPQWGYGSLDITQSINLMILSQPEVMP